MTSADFTSHLAPLDRWLCCALADDPAWHDAALGELWESLDESAAWDFAVKNRAESVVGLALRRVLGAGRLPPRWGEAISSTEKRLKLCLTELDRVAAALATEDIPLVALKNSGIARGLFPELAGCPMGDVDVLVDPTDFRRAHAVLGKLGYRLDSRSPLEVAGLEEAERHGGAEYAFQLADGSTLWFELQWRPVAGRWIRPDQEPPAADLIARSVPIAGSAARLLAPEDNLLQVCLHTAKHTYVRAPGFRLHTDVDRIVRRCTVGWQKFVAEVERLQVRTAVYLSLAIPTLLLRTPVPEWVLTRLQPAAWKTRLMLRWLWRVGLFDPDARKWSKPGYIVFNMLLYDTLDGLRRGLFPDAEWMQRRYEVKHRWSLPWWYAVRAAELTFKRAKT